jgi:hypothetical protein
MITFADMHRRGELEVPQRYWLRGGVYDYAGIEPNGRRHMLKRIGGEILYIDPESDVELMRRLELNGSGRSL